MATTSFSYSGTELDALVAAPNYYRFIARTFAPYVGQRAVEVGADLGEESMRISYSFACVLAVSAAMAASARAQDAVADFYKNKQMTLMIGSGAGG